LQRFKDADNMTDRFNALAALVHSGHELARPALARFHSPVQGRGTGAGQMVCAAGRSHQTAVVKCCRPCASCWLHPDFNLRNPNRARSVIFSYCSANPGAFHRADAAGYVFWSEQVMELDAINPQVAARLARALDRWKKLTEPYRSAAREALPRCRKSRPEQRCARGR
jgi:aminopeptidase N